MKRRMKVDKYHNVPVEESRPICPMCGEHTYEVEFEDQKYKLDGEEFTLKEKFFRCHKDGEIYYTGEMKDFNENQLRAYMMRKEVEKRAGVTDKVKIPSAVKAALDADDKKNMA